MLTVNELFAGIGSQRAALERLGVEHKVVGIAEIDKFAIKSYEAIWGETKNYGDISKIDKLDYADFWTYSFPCQDISVAGKQAGIEHGKTRSGLLYEVERLLEVARQHNELPKYLMLENVKNLVGKKFKPQFEEWITRLDELGYNTKWQILNSKGYGIPQNRERVFAISIRKDIDTGYVFPEPFELKTRLKDILEDEVDEKFYLDNEKTRNLIRQLDYKPTNEIKLNQLGNFEKLANPSKKFNDPQTGRVLDAEGICQALDTMQGGNRQPKILQVGNVNPSGNGMNGNVFNQEGLSPTITTNKGEGLKILESTGIDKSYNNPEIIECANCITAREDRGISNRKAEGTAVLIPQATKKGYIECNVPGVAELSYPNSKTRRGRVQEDGEICPTLTAGQQDICYMEPIIAASRGRNPNNPSDRTPGSPTEQRLEVNQKGTSNTITTVQKDNYVLEPLGTLAAHNSDKFGAGYMDSVSKTLKANKHDISVVEQVKRLAKTTRPNDEIGVSFKANGDIRPHRMDKKKSGIQELNINYEDNPSHTVTSAHMPKVYGNTTNYRIRKLTPLECWRLMGFTDEQFQKAQDAGVSNSQLYKQAGNSIVVDVLYYLFKNLFIDRPTEKTEPESELSGQMKLEDFI